MNGNSAFAKLLRAFERYYTVSMEQTAAPFVAEAEFRSHGEQYVFVKAAKVADIDSNEFVFFYMDEGISPLTPQKIVGLAETAWSRGLERITPYYGHRNSDVALVVLSRAFSEESFRQIKKLSFYKSYKFGLYGWSAFRALGYEVSTGRAVTNRRGSALKNLTAQL